MYLHMNFLLFLVFISLPDDPNSLSMDVGVDCHNFFPVSFEEFDARMKKKTFKPIDHHGV